MHSGGNTAWVERQIRDIGQDVERGYGLTAPSGAAPIADRAVI